MENACYNNVKFLGEKGKVLEAIIYATTSLRLIAIEIEILEEGSLGYLTSCEPNVTGIKRIADKFDLDFSLYYDGEGEGGDMIGDVTYEDGELTITELESEDYEQITYNEESELY